MRVVLIMCLLLVSCMTTKHTVVTKTSPITTEHIIGNTNKSFNSVSNSLNDSIYSSRKINEQLNKLLTLGINSDIVLDLKTTAANNLFSIEQTYKTLTTETKDSIFKLQTQSQLLQQQNKDLSTTVELLDTERSSITKQNIELLTKVDTYKSTTTKWRLIAISCISIVVFYIGLRLYLLFSTGGISSIINKFI